MSLWGLSWFEAIAATLGIVVLQVLSCLLAERMLTRLSSELEPRKPEDANVSGGEQQRAA